MRTFAGAEQFDALKNTVVGAYTKLFPVKNQTGYSLELRKVWVDDSGLDTADYTAQKKAKLAGNTWGAPVYAAIDLKDPTGKVVDHMDQVRLSTIPRLTPRGSYLVTGNEYQVSNQLRRKPGVYVVKRATGDQYKANFNLGGEASKNFELHLDPATQKYTVDKIAGSQGSIPLYPLLHALGVNDSDLLKKWGPELLAANKTKSDATSILKYAQKFTGSKTDNVATATDELKKWITGTKLDPHVTELTLGKAHTSLSADTLLTASHKLLGVYAGKEQPDDPESLLFKEVLGVEDMLHDWLGSKGRVSATNYMLSRHLGKKMQIKDIIDFKKLSSPVESFFKNDDRVSTPEQYNPMQMISNVHKLTLMGTGGIRDPHTLTSEIREVHPTQVGFVDPVHTVEGSKIGATLHLTAGLLKDGRELRTRVLNTKTHKLEFLSPRELYQKTVAFPDEATTEGGKAKFKTNEVRAQILGQVKTVKPSDVDYVFATHTQLFSPSTNMIPFLHNDQGTRAMMAAKHVEQAIPLVEREAPLVQTNSGGGTTFQKSVGEQFTVKAPQAGIITDIKPDYIELDKKTRVPIYNHFPLNQKTFIHHEPNVKVGDIVKQGQLIADSNFTKGGTLALGKNLKVAYLPYPGLTFEDGLVITESAAKKLATQQLYRHEFELDPGRRKTSLKTFSAYFPNAVAVKQLMNYDSDGVIKKGMVVQPGQVMIMGLNDNLASPEHATLKRINKSLAKPWGNASVRYTGEFPGVVTDVAKRADKVEVFVVANENARESDKLSGTHGNKGVITRVIPDNEAPRNAKGEIPDVFMNPHGIISRMNLGQLYESAASKIALKTGKPYVVTNFNGEDSSKKLTEELAAHGLSDQEEMTLPNGKSIGKVSVGNPYILRLAKTGKTGFSARMPGSGYDLNMQPTKGGEEGTKSLDPMTFYCMLSHGAKKNLLDAHMKSEKNDELWRAIETGKTLPTPQPSFAWNKFMSLLRGAGINPIKQGPEITLAPMTDADVKKLSRGEIKDPEFLYGKNLKEKSGGFFDKQKTGGLFGTNYTHMELKEVLPNPIFEKAIRSLTNLSDSDYNSILSGQKYVMANGAIGDRHSAGAMTGGPGIHRLLSLIDVSQSTHDTQAELKKVASNPTKFNLVSRKLRYLSALKELNLKPEEAYTRKFIPVIPPIHRPIYEMGNRGLQVAPANKLYQNVGILNESQELPVMKLLGDEDKSELRQDLYKSTRALAGLEPLVQKSREQVPIQGFMSQIAGTNPKSGFFLQKVVSKRQDLTGRGVVTNAPDLSVDQLGIPEKMAWKIFRPFVIREYTQSGVDAAVARKELDEQTPRAKKMLQSTMAKRTVLMNRAPSLHKFSIMAFKPVLSEGLAIRVPPLVMKGFNMDVDGDCQLNHVVIKLSANACKWIISTLGSSYLEERDVTARFKVAFPVKQSDMIAMFDLQDFPVGTLASSKDGKNGRIDFYAAIHGTEVMAYDEATGQLKWAPVSYWSKHYQREIEIVSLASGKQIFTDDDPRAVYGIPAGSLTIGRYRPEEALNKSVLVPRAIRLETPNDVTCIPYAKLGSGIREDENRELTLDADLGYAIGAFAGDGWADGDRVCLACNVEPIFEKVRAALIKHRLVKDSCTGGRIERKGEGYGPLSIKYTFGSKSLSNFIEKQIGKGAQNKHLPSYFLGVPKSFRIGLFAGLMDTDGSICIGKAKSKKSPQLIVNFSTTSFRLAREIQLLALSLEIRSSICATKTPLGKPAWSVIFSSVDCKKWNGEFLQHPEKLQKLQSIEIRESNITARLEIVPISYSLAEHLRKNIGAPRDADKEHKSIYSVVAQAATKGFITRQSARKVMEKIGTSVFTSHPDGSKWLTIYENNSITWDRVLSFERTGIKEDGYDLTVPGYETFMTVDGVVLSNTVTLHVPISEESIKESHKMFPSKNLFKPGTGEIMIQPSQESAIGLYFLSQTPAGREKINHLLPAKFHVTSSLESKEAKVLYNRIAHEAPEEFAKLVTDMKFLGDKTAYERGFSVGLKDIAVSRAGRDKIFATADKHAKDLTHSMKPGLERDNKTADLYSAAAKESYAGMEAGLKASGNSFYSMVNSGARGTKSQLMQLLAAPGALEDAKSRKIPIPVKKSYAEGLSTGDYFVSAYGVRKGMMDKSLQTSQPGALNKDIMASTLDNIVTAQDCGIQHGILLPISSADVRGRLLAHDQGGFTRNTLVTPQLVSQLHKKGIKEIEVRSPMKCVAHHGTCAHCYGLDEHDKLPEIGENIGVKAGQAMSEPLTQFAMKAFHTGGISSGAPVAGGFERVQQLLRMPEYVAGEAALAKVPGSITAIKKLHTGGHEIYVGKEIHLVRPGLSPVVKIGDEVAAGDTLTQGVIKPTELLKYKGMQRAQDYIVDELHKAYHEQGVPMQRKVFETVVRSVGNLTKVISSPKQSDFAAGDVIPWSTAVHYNDSRLETRPTNDAQGFRLLKPIGTIPANKELTDKDVAHIQGLGFHKIDVVKDPLIHAPIIQGIERLPLLKKDWLANVGYRYIKDTLTQGASQAWKTHVEGSHPVPAFAYGATFGKKKGEY